MKWFLKCMRNYANFRGRARRKEFWYFLLMLFVIALFAQIVYTLCFAYSPYIIYAVWLACLLPYFAVAVRRLHDTGRSGWWGGGYLFVCIAVRAVDYFSGTADAAEDGAVWIQQMGTLLILLYLLFLLVVLCLKGDAGPNKYGPDPKMVRE